jgi:7-cyano-7-deazaguanine synthase in queuosine biosynthesis
VAVKRAEVLLTRENCQTKADLVLCPGKNLVTGESAFRKYFASPSTLECDVLRVAAAIYATDVAFPRGERERYPRSVQLQVPVVNHAAFNAIREQLQFAISLLAGDSWSLSFTRAPGTPEAQTGWPNTTGEVLLFSGGLDSFAKAVELTGAHGTTTLVSHDSGNPATSKAQKALLAHLTTLSATAQTHYGFRVRGQSASGWRYPSVKEGSQRTRSFLFVTLGSLVARRAGASRVLLMAENGQMAIHLPLTAARIGAFSTRTAHPEVLARLEEVFCELLDMKLEVSNPYLYRTKAEVVEGLCQPQHASALPESVSCWKASRVTGDATHCGFCVPCIVRRIALEHWGYGNTTAWGRDLLAEPVAQLADDDDGKKNLMELLEFTRIFGSTLAEAELIMEFPTLISRYFSLSNAIAMYRRFAQEAGGVFKGYPSVKALM